MKHSGIAVRCSDLLALFPFMRAPLTAGAMVQQAHTTDDGGGVFLIHLLSKNQPVTLPDPAPCLQKLCQSFLDSVLKGFSRLLFDQAPQSCISSTPPSFPCPLDLFLKEPLHILLFRQFKLIFGDKELVV